MGEHVSSPATFKYVDLFAGIGGFAAVLEALGGENVYSCEIDPAAAAVYERNWGHPALGDITKVANDDVVDVPAHDVLAAGFPCQPFSKSGAQRGMEETRGTLFWNILKIVQKYHPRLVLLENVRNLAGPRHMHEWEVIIRQLRDQGYHVSEKATVFSPHLLPLENGGRPQVRERVFIAATYDPDHIMDVTDDRPLHEFIGARMQEEWSLTDDLPLDLTITDENTLLTEAEIQWIEAWNVFVEHMWPAVRAKASEGTKVALPGFPIWADAWITSSTLDAWAVGKIKLPYTDRLGNPIMALPATWDEVPAWKQTFLKKNAAFYTEHKEYLDHWLVEYKLETFPASRRKLEWQAQDTARLWDCVLQLRPSGIRAKRPTHLPALVAITQTSIIGPQRRRLSTREAARLQGLPDNYDFGPQSDATTYKQLGNGVNVGAVWNVLKAHVERDKAVLRTTAEGQRLYDLISSAPADPTDRVAEVLEQKRRPTLPPPTV